MIGFCDSGVRFVPVLFGFVPFLRGFERGKIDVSHQGQNAAAERDAAEAEKLLEF